MARKGNIRKLKVKEERNVNKSGPCVHIVGPDITPNEPPMVGPLS